MGRKQVPGIYRGRDNRWHVDKVVRGDRFRHRGCESYRAAEDWLTAELSKRRGLVAGEVPTFDQAAARYVTEFGDRDGLEDAVYQLELVVPHIGTLRLDQVDNDALRSFVAAMRQARSFKGRVRPALKSKSINHALGRVRRVLNLAATEWKREDGSYWLPRTPAKITLLDEEDARPPMQLAWREQREHLHELPDHLARMALFDLNTGLRDRPLCNLRWQWEVRLSELGCSVFIVPPEFVKGRSGARVVVCNSVAQSIIESVRGMHPEFVFVYSRIRREGRKPIYRPIETMDNSAWQKWRARYVPGFRVHDLRHTVGMRLREAGVARATRADILWHAHEGMTEHYAVAQVLEIRNALELITSERHANNRSLASLIRERSVPAEVPTPNQAVA